jgi:tRNA-specific 2-thiouridylase
LRKAQGLGIDFVATGHYARVRFDDQNQRYCLSQAKDHNKDQSYALFSLRQSELSKIMMPLGGYDKKRVREIARFFGLKTHDKQESQDICFLDSDTYGDFLKKRLGEKIKPGKIVDSEGKTLGRHKGICFYTIGQRSGLGISARKPLYVIKIDPKNNRIVVGTKEQTTREVLLANEINWISGSLPEQEIAADVKIRYNHPKSPAVLKLRNDHEVEVEFKDPQPAVTPGQAAVFYKGEQVLGGGWIR